MSEYTPTTEWVRFAYSENKWAARTVTPTTEQERKTDEEFDRWLERVRAEERERTLTRVGYRSDGYHTFNELYEYRMLYNAHAALGWLAVGYPVVKSWRHSDGELCFGGGWFVVSAQLPSGQVTNHYKADEWELFAVPEVERAPEWDGHTPADAAVRLRAAIRAVSVEQEDHHG